MGRPQMIGGYNRFQYGGYWFGYNQGWPVGWGYNDNVYVVYEGGGYFMYDLMHPGIHIALNIFLTIYPAHLRGRIPSAGAGGATP